jgi:hypothetical protein
VAASEQDGPSLPKHFVAFATQIAVQDSSSCQTDNHIQIRNERVLTRFTVAQRNERWFSSLRRFGGQDVEAVLLLSLAPSYAQFWHPKPIRTEAKEQVRSRPAPLEVGIWGLDSAQAVRNARNLSWYAGFKTNLRPRTSIKETNAWMRCLYILPNLATRIYPKRKLRAL